MRLQDAICSVEGCNRQVYARGWCPKHYSRQSRNGGDPTPEKKPPGWGRIGKHPLHSQWMGLLTKARAGIPIAPEWDGNFEQFEKDLGGVPPKDCRFLPINPALPIGPKNFAWVKKHVIKQPGESRKSYASRAHKSLSERRPEFVRAMALKTRFGITQEQYDDILAKQDGKCAICRQDESCIMRGKKIRLALDHDHLTMLICGALCTACNRGLGYFRNDPARLLRAIRYLRNPPVSIPMTGGSHRYHKQRGAGATRKAREAALDAPK